jgi:hypothetical protein
MAAKLYLTFKNYPSLALKHLIAKLNSHLFKRQRQKYLHQIYSLAFFYQQKPQI